VVDVEMDTDLVLNDVDEIDEEELETSRTYNIDWVNGRITGMIDGLDAVEQAMTKVLLTERYKNLIYDDEYGSEIKDTVMSEDNTNEFLESEIPELTKDAFANDERVLSVDNFSVNATEGDTLSTSFDASTIYGNLSFEEVF
jgi:phage baseplate assembly protein W